jgi:hypothetical protein
MRRRRTHLSIGILLVAALALVATSFAIAGGRHDGRGKNDERDWAALLKGSNEVPYANSKGSAVFTATVAKDEKSLTFKLDYKDLSGNPLFAHVHIGQPRVNGGVSFFLCGGGGKPACPAATSGSVTGTVLATDVLGPTAQNFAAGDLASVLAAIRNGAGYANMHTPALPGGEIRGQLFPAHGFGHKDDHH